MVDQQANNYVILARVQAGLGLLAAIIVFGGYVIFPSLMQDNSIGFTVAVLGMASVIYFATIHQLLGKTRQALSTLILSFIGVGNLIILIASTGGLDSPYYALWLLAVVAAGLFGSLATTLVLTGTTMYYIFEILRNGLDQKYFADHIVQLVMSLIAGALAEFIFHRSRHVVSQTAKVATLSGQLSEESLKAKVLMSSMGEGVLVVDAQRRIQLFNRAAQTSTGWDEKSAQGIDYNLVLKLKTADDQAITETTDPFAKAWTTHAQVICTDLTMTTQGGRKLSISLSVSPIYDNTGVVTGAIGLFRDISQEKAVERQKDEFVSTASHEMRTPVAAIEGYISLAMNPNVATIDDRAKNYLNKAHDAIQHLGELFRDLLSVTKAEEGKLQTKAEAVNVTELVKSAVDDMQFTVQKKGLSLVFQASSNGDIKAIAPIYFVKANPERLREVVMNLIDNAVKFTPTGGITVSLTGNDKEVRVAVADTGVGIANEDAAHLFQKFYRIDSSATRTIGGTGLGLYLCRTVIELFGGRIWVEGKVGKGSTFTFMLPRITDEQVSALQAQTAAEKATSGTMQAVATAGAATQTPIAATPVAVPVAAPVATPAAPQAFPDGSMAAPNPALTQNAAATVAAALAAHPAPTAPSNSA